MVISFDGHTPSLHPSVRLAPTAAVVGRASLEEGVSLWYGAVVQADEEAVTVGAGTNLQDNCILHSDPGYPLTVGQNVTVGHGAILHGCTVGDGSLIGMGAILLNGCSIGAGAMVAAGALVTQHTVIPPGFLAVGSPARAVRPLRREEAEELIHSAETYRRLAAGQLPAAGEGGAL